MSQAPFPEFQFVCVEGWDAVDPIALASVDVPGSGRTVAAILGLDGLEQELATGVMEPGLAVSFVDTLWSEDDQLAGLVTSTALVYFIDPALLAGTEPSAFQAQTIYEQIPVLEEPIGFRVMNAVVRSDDDQVAALICFSTPNLPMADLFESMWEEMAAESRFVVGV